MTTTKKAPVAKKATLTKEPAPKKPTIKSLQQEVANLTEQLVYANKLCNELTTDVVNLNSDLAYLEQEVTRLNGSLRSRDQTILKLEVPFYRKIFNLFGN